MKKNVDLFYPPIIQSAIAGIANIQFCQKMLNLNCGMVTLGGLSIDKKSKNATKMLISQGREEFLLPESFSEIEKWCKNISQLKKIKPIQKIAANIRLVEIDNMSSSWLEHLIPYVDYLEINAHCRQKEIVDIGGGQALLGDLKHLEELLQKINLNFSTAVFGIKIRGYIVNNVNELINILDRNRCGYIHIDAMVPNEESADLEQIQEFTNSTDIPIIGNNSVRTTKDIRKMLSIGAKAVSIARPLINNPTFMESLVTKYLSEYK